MSLEGGREGRGRGGEGRGGEGRGGERRGGGGEGEGEGRGVPSVILTIFFLTFLLRDIR